LFQVIIALFVECSGVKLFVDGIRGVDFPFRNRQDEVDENRRLSG
jgi:hypothetical protein